jgi:phosphate uptake regulator
MLTYEGIARNLRLLAAQVSKQLLSTQRLLENPSDALREAIAAGDDYIDTQKAMIENACFALVRELGGEDERLSAAVRAISVVAANVERIGDFAVNIARQTQHLREPAELRRFDLRAYIEPVRGGIELIERALAEHDSSLALRICAVEEEVDRFYAADLARAIAAMNESQRVDDLVTALFILHYLERMGDALQNIGEALLMAASGERLKVHQFRALKQVLAPAEDQPLDEVQLASIWGTRSGMRVGKAEKAAVEHTPRVLFKEGNPQKLELERDNLLRWQALAPGLAPAVVEFRREGQVGALILEYLEGATLQELILSAEPAIIAAAQKRLKETLRDLWQRTRRPGPVYARFLAQLADRLPDVHVLHPDTKRGGMRIGNVVQPALGELLAELRPLDEELPAPASVFIHGDFNLDNILYDVRDDRLHFLDVHRSRDSDYVQDVSVFLVSNFRLPVFVRATRRRLEAVALDFLNFARGYAAQTQDELFEARLALGLARSFATSTRFEVKGRFVHDMHERAVLLLSSVREHRGRPWAEFRVPDGVLVY